MAKSLREIITEKADIVGIISQYVKLTKKGNSYIGLCPFHDDKNPSLSVSPSKKVFKCFSCGAGGDVITFVSKFKNISASEALRTVADIVGIKVGSSKEEEERRKNAKYYMVLKEAANFFRFFLKNTKEGEEGLAYLARRSLDEVIIDRFEIGMAGKDNILFQVLTQKNYLPLDIMATGLIRGDGEYKDVFHSRIMFPIKDLEGNTVGFSGRRFLPASDKESKYINTVDTVVFKKGNILYNYSDALAVIKSTKTTYLFEGFMDVIAAVRSGIDNAVASMGTSLTVNQARAIRKASENVVICYDNDTAGSDATLKAIDMFIPLGLNIEVATIPESKDPDEYLRSHSPAELNTILKTKKIHAMDFIYQKFRKGIVFDNIREKEVFQNHVYKYLRAFASTLLTDKYLKILSTDLDVSLSMLVNDFQNKRIYPASDIIPPIDIKERSPKKKNHYQREKCFKSECMLLKAALEDKKTCLEIDAKLDNYFYDHLNRDLLYKMMTFYQTHNQMDLSLFAKELTKEEEERCNNVFNRELCPAKEEIIDLINNIKNWPYLKRIETLGMKDEKSTEDLQELVTYKKMTTRIVRKKKE